MKKYYTRVCNFYYGINSQRLINKKKTIPLNGNLKISFDHIEILSRNSNKLIHIKEIKNLPLKLKKKVNKDLIFLVPTGSQMEKAGTKLGIKIATEIFADRNYEDDGNLVSRSKNNALVTDPKVAKKHVIKMVENQALNCYSGKQIPCKIDSICVHGDGESAVSTAKEIKEGLIKSGIILRPLDKMKKFI